MRHRVRQDRCDAERRALPSAGPCPVAKQRAAKQKRRVPFMHPSLLWYWALFSALPLGKGFIYLLHPEVCSPTWRPKAGFRLVSKPVLAEGAFFWGLVGLEKSGLQPGQMGPSGIQQ